MQVDLGSDQSSLHIPFSGGYYPAGVSLEKSRQLMREDPAEFKKLVEGTLRRHAVAINTLTETRGMYFFDYGNAFLLQCSRAGAEIMDTKDPGSGRFRYASYVEDIMGPMCFDFGFGPFRWVCTSGEAADLQTTDEIACEVLENVAKASPVPTYVAVHALAPVCVWVHGGRGLPFHHRTTPVPTPSPPAVPCYISSGSRSYSEFTTLKLKITNRQQTHFFCSNHESLLPG